MRDVLAKMRECGKDVKMRDFPHDCGMVDTYGMRVILSVKNLEKKSCTVYPEKCNQGVVWISGGEEF